MQDSSLICVLSFNFQRTKNVLTSNKLKEREKELKSFVMIYWLRLIQHKLQPLYRISIGNQHEQFSTRSPPFPSVLTGCLNFMLWSLSSSDSFPFGVTVRKSPSSTRSVGGHLDFHDIRGLRSWLREVSRFEVSSLFFSLSSFQWVRQ